MMPFKISHVAGMQLAHLEQRALLLFDTSPRTPWAFAMIAGQEVQMRYGYAGKTRDLRAYFKVNGERASVRAVYKHIAWAEGQGVQP